MQAKDRQPFGPNSPAKSGLISREEASHPSRSPSRSYSHDNLHRHSHRSEPLHGYSDADNLPRRSTAPPGQKQDSGLQPRASSVTFKAKEVSNIMSSPFHAILTLSEESPVLCLAQLTSSRWYNFAWQSIKIRYMYSPAAGSACYRLTIK